MVEIKKLGSQPFTKPSFKIHQTNWHKTVSCSGASIIT